MPSQRPERAQDRQALERLDKSQLVALVLQQQAALERLSAEVDRLSSLLAKDSRTSSAPYGVEAADRYISSLAGHN